jgi:hypothetical protein
MLPRLITRSTEGAAVAAALLLLATSPAFAAMPANSTSGSSFGIDVSWPQCPWSNPKSAEAFGVIGVNGGLANNYSSCLRAEFNWAATSTTGTSAQPRAQLYVSTADPGAAVADWPYGSDGAGLSAFGQNVSAGGATPYGSCTGSDNTAACAYVYGYNMVEGVTAPVVGDINDFKAATSKSPSGYPWWLDVETGNSWQSDTTMNVADLQGMVYALQNANSVAVIGVYSTSYQWNTITGTPGTSISYGGATFANTLWSLPNWIPGARTQSGAASHCSLPSFTGGTVTVTQWFGHPYDGDFACPS